MTPKNAKTAKQSPGSLNRGILAVEKSAFQKIPRQAAPDTPFTKGSGNLLLVIKDIRERCFKHRLVDKELESDTQHLKRF